MTPDRTTCQAGTGSGYTSVFFPGKFKKIKTGEENPFLCSFFSIVYSLYIFGRHYKYTTKLCKLFFFDFLAIIGEPLGQSALHHSHYLYNNHHSACETEGRQRAGTTALVLPSNRRAPRWNVTVSPVVVLKRSFRRSEFEESISGQ